jgi:O-antigen/teichoic acid export membrane protein
MNRIRIDYSFLRIYILKNFSLLITFAYGVVLARSLGAESRGVYAYITTVTLILMTFAHGSLEQSHIYLHRLGISIKGLARGAFQFSLIAGGIVSAISLILFSWKSSSYDSNPLAWNIAFLSIPAGIFSIFTSSLMNISGKAQLTTEITLRINVVQLFLITMLTITNQISITLVVIVWSLSLWTLALLAVRRDYEVLRFNHFQDLVKQLRIGAKYHLGMISIFMLFRVDLLILAKYVDASEIGKYAIAVAFAETLFLISDSSVMSSLKKLVDSSKIEANSISLHLLRQNTFMLIFSAIAVGIFAKLFFPILFGDSYIGSSDMLIVLLPGIVAYGIAKSVFTRINIENSPAKVSAVALISLLLNICLNFILIPKFGGIGAGIATSISYFFLTTVYLLWFRSLHAPDDREVF